MILPGLAPRPVLQPVERALAGHRRTVRTLGLELAGQHMEQRVVTKLIVVVQVFIAEREGEHALADQGLDRVLEQSWVAPVGETAGHPTDQPEAAIQPPQQQPSGIRCDDSAIEPGHNLVPFNRFKFEQCWATLCLHRGLSGIAVSDWRIAISRDSPHRCIKGFEKSGLVPARYRPPPPWNRNSRWSSIEASCRGPRPSPRYSRSAPQYRPRRKRVTSRAEAAPSNPGP